MSATLEGGVPASWKLAFLPAGSRRSKEGADAFS